MSIENDIPFEIGLFLKLMGINNSPVPIIKGISKLKIMDLVNFA